MPVIVNLGKAKKLFCALALQLSFTVLTAQQHHHHSCAALVQTSFERGIALLHSFWYEEALKQFQSVAAADPQCAMAHWAIAMTEWRPFLGWHAR